jgi:hypothetical protein
VSTLSLLDDVEVHADALVSSSAPWLLHVHVVDPHFPYDAPEQYLDTTVAVPEIGFDLADPMDLQRLEKEWP